MDVDVRRNSSDNILVLRPLSSGLTTLKNPEAGWQYTSTMGKLKNKLELRIGQLRMNHQLIQSLDEGWIKHLYGLEAGDFRDREAQDYEEYAINGRNGNPRYLDTVINAIDMET